MNRNWRVVIYLGAAVALLAITLAAPGVWATPGQNASAQTVPTRTPSSEPIQPTTPPQATPEPPTPTPLPGAPTPVGPAVTATVAATGRAPAQRSPLALSIVADREQVWPDAIVTFTLTVANQGPALLQQVQVEDLLAQGLEPLEIVTGDAVWDGDTLRATAASLRPGERLVYVYTARVSATAPGEAIITRARATAAGGAQAAATLTLGLPPSELPATGGCLP